MTYQEILEANPGLRDEGDKLSATIKKVADALRNGFSTTALITVVGELGMLALSAFPTIQSLPSEHRVVVFGEAFDGVIGTEETALLTEMGFLGPESVEAVGDALKIAAGSYWLSRLESVETGGE